MAEGADIASGRLRPQDYAQNFDDLVPPLDHDSARVEADRCYFCYDAPCIACEDTSHQAIRQSKSNGARRYEVIDEAVEIDNGKPPLTWDRHPNNPMRQVAPE